MRCPSQRGFTLVELLLVIGIFMLITGIVVPMFVTSFAGAKLRTSVRAVAMTHRYARNLAILRQRPVAMVVNTQSNTLEVVLLTGRESEDLTELTMPADENAVIQENPENIPAEVDLTMTNSDTALPDVTTVELLKALDPGIAIESFESQRPKSEDQNSPNVIVYYPSGLCDGFTVRLRDERERNAEIAADPLTGQVDVKYPEN